MAFRKVGGQRTYYKYRECERGQALVKEGRYLGPSEGKYGIEHMFMTQDGTQTVVLNSAGHLNWLLETYATPGKTICNVIYLEKIVLTKGDKAGKEAHTFELQIDDGGESVVISSKDMPDEARAGRAAAYDGPDISL